MPEAMERRAMRGASARAGLSAVALAGTMVADAVAGTPARFTLDNGDGTVIRGPWSCTPTPVAGDAVLVIRDDNGTYWVAGVWPSS